MKKKFPHRTIWKRAYPKVNRNDLCPCGSGKKYKDCQCDKSKFESYAIYAVDPSGPDFDDLKQT